MGDSEDDNPYANPVNIFLRNPTDYTKEPFHYIPGMEPDYFSWIVPDLLAGAAFPHNGGHLQYMVDNNIKQLVSLTEWRPPVPLEHYPAIKWTHISIRDEEAPRMDQIVQLMDIIDKARQNKEKILIHCEWGCGRTGLMGACYLVRHYDISWEEAVHKMRRLRPYSIETPVQEKAVREYEEFFRKSKH